MFVLVLSCAGSPVCENRRDEAVAQVLAVTDTFTACDVAEDCQVVWITGDCFDACSRVVGIGGVVATDAAIADANRDVCAKVPYCPTEVPPCVPPGTSQCVDHVCLEL